MTTKSDFTQQIMDFRGAYLRAVARASVDLEFRKKLTERNQSLAVLKEAFDYECPWYLNLRLLDDPQRGPRLNPAKGRVMTLPYWGEAITVYIPRKPPGDARTQLDALAAYYQDNPWFLRNKQEALDDSKDGAQSQGKLLNMGTVPVEGRDPPQPFGSKWTSVDVDRDRYDLGDNIEDFISLAAAIFNAVALAWDNELLWNELTAYKGQEGEPRARTITILKEWLGYVYPWELDLIIQPDPTAEYVPYTQQGKGGWRNTTPPELMLTLPWMSGVDPQGGDVQQDAAKAAAQEVAQNQKNPSVAIMGLALYNTDGAGYPFTCG